MRKWLTPWSSVHARSMLTCVLSILSWTLPRATRPPTLRSNTTWSSGFIRSLLLIFPPARTDERPLPRHHLTFAAFPATPRTGTEYVRLPMLHGAPHARLSLVDGTGRGKGIMEYDYNTRTIRKSAWEPYQIFTEGGRA